MSAVDAPPGLAIHGVAAGEFAAKPRARALSRIAFYYVLLIGIVTFVVAARRIHKPLIEFLLVSPLMCTSVAAVGFAVRRARLRVDGDGVRWGWAAAGFRMTRARLKNVYVYANAVALTPKRGSTWYLTQYDWDRFDRLLPALRNARIDFTQYPSRAPLAARLQSYGIVLDLLLIVNALASTVAFVAALSLL